MSTKSVIAAFHRIDAIDPESDSAFQDITDALKSIDTLPIFIFNCHPERVFRSRPHSQNIFYDEIKQIYLTPSEYVTSYARCNKPNQSLFYCSEMRPVSYMELIDYWVESSNNGEQIYVTLGRWELLNPINVALITTPDVEKRESDFDKHHGPILDHFLSQLDLEMKEAHVLFFRYMFEKFRKPAKDDLKTYLITAAYSNLVLLNEVDPVDGICYPSVPSMQIGENYAFKAEFCVKENIRLTHVIRNQFTRSNQENGIPSFQESMFHQASEIDIDTGTIKW